MSKNSFRIDDILSKNHQANNNNNQTNKHNSIDLNNNVTELQKTLNLLLSQQITTSQHSHTNNMQDHYLTEYYTRLFNLARFNNNNANQTTNNTQYNIPDDFYQSAKRFKPSPPAAVAQDQLQSLFQNKYLQLPTQIHSKGSTKSLSYSSASSTASSLSTSSLSNSNIDVINSSPRSLLSNSDENMGSSNNSTGGASENVSPLDALLHLANNTFTGKMNSNFNGNKHMEDAAPLLNQIHNFRKNAYVNDENLLLANELLHESSKTSHNNSFDSSINSSISKFQSKPARLINKSPDNTISAAAAAKRKRKNRTAFTANQIFELEKRFSNQRYLSPHDRDRIAYELSLSTAQVITWFQNRRAKQKRDIEELKNDVTAAKTLKVIDSDVGVDKMMIRSDSETSNLYGDIKREDYYTSDNEYMNSDEEQETNVSTSNSSIDLNK